MTKCEICKEDTPMESTKRCNRCWELEKRILADPMIARLIIYQVEAVTQIQMSQGHESGFVILALTNLGRMFCKMDGITASNDWIEVEQPPMKG